MALASAPNERPRTALVGAMLSLLLLSAPCGLAACASAQGSGTFNAFKEALPGDPTVYVADPTPFVYSTDLGQAWGITSYPRPGEVYIYRLSDAANRSARPVSPTFSVTKSKVHSSK